MENTTLINITIIFAVSIPVLYVFLQLKLPLMLAFLFVGIALGPYGFGIIHTITEVEVLAEIGVVLLLFTIGIEFSLSNLQKMKRSVLLGGAFQMISTIAVTQAIALAFGYSWKVALFFGFLVVMSSTAIVFKLLQERSELESPHGLNAAAILIFQDLMVVPLILIIPSLAEAQNASQPSVVLVLTKAAMMVGGLIIIARLIVPKILYLTAKTRSRELFLLLITVICLATAWLTHAVGLSPALGAFMAGLIISESEYSHEAVGNIMPLKDLFTGLFFVSVGMLADLRMLWQSPILIVIVVVGIIIVKTIFSMLAVIVLGYPFRTAFLTGTYLAQIGEFSFLLAKIGNEWNIITKNEYQIFIIVVVFAMGVTPFIVKAALPLVNALEKLSLVTIQKSQRMPDEKIELHEHLIIVGYGINGRNLAKVAKFTKIPYIIVEMNPTTVRKEKEKGEHIFFGDATHEAVLVHAGIQYAKVMVVAIADHAATLRITKIARRLNPNLYIIIRTRFFQDVPTIYALGANEVIPEEYETSIEIFSRVLTKYLVPRQEIEKLISMVRAEGYQMLRSLSISSDAKQAFINIPNLEILRIEICQYSPFAGKKLRDLELRSKYGITVVAIERNGEIVANPSADEVLEAGEVVIIMGTKEHVESISRLLEKGMLCQD